MAFGKPAVFLLKSSFSVTVAPSWENFTTSGLPGTIERFASTTVWLTPESWFITVRPRVTWL